YTGREDFLVGTHVAGRNRAETEGLIGFFINELVLRADLSGDPSFLQLLPRVRETALDAYAYEDLPFDRLVEALQPERDLARPPVMQVLFVLQNLVEASLESLELPGLTLAPFQAAVSPTTLDLMLEAMETGSGLLLSARYNADLFDPPTIDRLLGHFEALLESASASPETRLSLLPLLTGAERQQLVREWNDSGAVFPGGGATFPEIFAARATARPDEVAAICGAERLTYGELDARADRLARLLSVFGVGTDDVVALLADRGLEFLIAVLATFKAGAAYLPLDPRQPRRAWARLVAGSGARLALAGLAHLPALAEAAGDLPLLALEEALAEADPGVLPLSPPEPGDLAYVIYTSGSTGVPKGSMINHGGMLNHLWAKVAALDLGETDVVAQTATQTFDISVWQFLAALLAGGRVEIFPDEVAHHPARLFAEVESRRVTVLETVPSLLRLALEELGGQGDSRPALASLRWLIPTGEALPPELCRRWLELYPGIPLLNAYGPTECSDDVTHHPIRSERDSARAVVPIGRPVPNLKLYVLDRGFEPLPAGVPGELFVGGAGVGRGYLKDGERTAQSFVPDPWSGEAGARLYRTGDLARFRADGS
ncbi:MAG TPA: amino acid adenylation domain-containing protein, partial [Thermoanaerobaculia bacterium]|nr:amino acid adenylation domain-containing protein [Thermoanaerobaculia bacterium]